MFNGIFSYNIQDMANTRSASKKTTTKSTKASKKAVTLPAAKTKKATPKKRMAAKKSVVSVSDKVDYYPNRMTLAISVLAGTLIVLLALIAVLGQS